MKKGTSLDQKTKANKQKTNKQINKITLKKTI